MNKYKVKIKGYAHELETTADYDQLLEIVLDWKQSSNVTIYSLCQRLDNQGYKVMQKDLTFDFVVS